MIQAAMPFMGGCKGGKSLPANMKEGDWMCDSCGNHNFADKVNCNRCNIPKPMQGMMNFGFGGCMGAMGGMPRMQRMQSMPNMNMMAMHNMNMMGAMGCGGCAGAGPGNMKDGDWMCHKCGNHNYASRVVCKKCQVQKPGTKRGDWICRACRNHNYASKTACNKCAEPKTEE